MGSEIREGFVRQRRNLILGSFLLLFAQIADMKIDKVSFFGNDIILAHSYSITAMLWIVTLYWFIRFYQYSRDLNSTEEITLAERIKFNSYMPEVVMECLKDTQPQHFKPPEDKPGSTTTVVLKDYSCLEAREHFHRGTVQMDVFWSHEGKTGFHAIGPIEVIVEKEYLWLPRLRARLYVYINTTKFTEYILPFIVFLLPLVYTLISWLWVK